MASVPSNVSSLIAWRQLLEHLGIEAFGGALPCAARCPSCRRPELTLYQDTIQRGEWHFCRGCGACGDNLELAARARGLSVEAAAEHLARVGLLDRARATPDAVAAYKAWYVDRRAQTAAFWERCREHFHHSGRESVAFKQFLDSYNSLDWASRGGRFAGAVSSSELLAYVAPHQWIRDDRHAWNDAEAGVLAFHDMPGRLSAFLFVRGGRGDHMEKIYRHSFSNLKHATVYRNVPGAVALEAAFLPPDQTLGDTLFVFMDPMVAMRTHTRHFNSSNEMLPVVGCWPEAAVPPVLRDMAPGRDVVVWSQEADADALRYARELNARLLTHDTCMEDVRTKLKRYGTPRPWLEIVRRRALPWRRAAHRLLGGMSLAKAEALLTAMGLPHEELKEFAAGAPAGLRERLGQTRLLAESRRALSLDWGEIIEDDNGWRNQKGDCVTEVIIRVETVYTKPGEVPVQWYQGRLLYKGRELPFTAWQKDIEAHPLRWASKLIAAQGWGVPRYKERVSKKSLEVALAFHAPDLVVLPERYGWSDAEQCFIAPRFRIGRLGAVAPNDAPKLPMTHTPALNLAPPVPMCNDELLELAGAPAGPVLWPAVVAVLHNLLAPVYGYEQRGVAVAGHRARDFLKAAEAAGCPPLLINWTGEPTIKNTLGAEQPGSWPLAIHGRPQRSAVWTGWLSRPHNALIELDELSARVAHCRGDWDVLLTDALFYTGECCDEVTPRELDLVSRLLPDVLQYAASQGWSKGLWGRNPVDRVLEWLSSYYASRGLDVGDRLADASSLLECGRDWEVEGFLRVVIRLYDEGCFRVEQEGAGPRKPSESPRPDTRPVLLFTADAVWVPKAGLNDVLHSKHYPTLDVGKVSDKLRGKRNERMFRGEEDRRGEAGWWFSRQWWENDLSELRQGTRSRLRIASEG